MDFRPSEIAESAHDYADRQKAAALAGFKSADSYIAIISYTMASYFMVNLTANDHVDVDFISLLIRYSLFFGLIYVVKMAVINTADKIKALVDIVVYDVLMDLFNFAGILFVVIIVRLVQDYFEFTTADLFPVAFLFVSFSFFVRMGSRFASNAEI